ncbi:tyrosinase family protein [Paenibacillus massiliensis]|uniref:tyrosinase family protein n=1 Tax=Paenibacillus massiliensis TaxID=225917 RepID=UPI00042417B6|nr:tyrosinase family protein [Paenibacillus massiliensis]
MHLRKEIRSLSPEELLALRRAMIEFQLKEGQGSYIDLAGYHGIPGHRCPHGSPLFLPWHRAYIRTFEQSLQSIDSTVSLPFWDWTSSESLAQGMASAHSDESFEMDGSILANPLMSGPIEDRSRNTRRMPPHELNQLRSFALSVNIAMSQINYLSFNNFIEEPHGSIHVWVGGQGGDMSSVPRAAYDPIFWSHHSNVDRQWAIWQKCHINENPTDDLMSQLLDGFPNWRVADTIDISSSRLDYTYEGLDAITCPTRSEENFINEIKSRIIVEVKDIVRDNESFMVDIFLEDETSSSTSKVFAGSFGIFGAEGLHGTGHDVHHHHGVKTNQHIDVSEAVKKLELSADQIQSVQIHLQATNKEGDVIDSAKLPIGSMDIRMV